MRLLGAIAVSVAIGLTVAACGSGGGTQAVARPPSIRTAIAEVKRPLEDQWVHVFQDFQAQ